MARLTAYNIWIVAFCCLGSWTYGFSFAVFVTSIGQPGFYVYFDLDPTSSYTASILGAVNSLFAFGAAVGAISQGWTSNWLGRKWSLFLASLLCVIGGALTAGSINIPMIICCRFIQGLGLGQVICLTPLYVSEVSPPKSRGILLGMFTIGIGIGYSVCAWIGFATYYAKDKTVQWRTPLALACLTPAIICAGVFFIPEPPRWLVYKHRKDEAWTIIQRLHRDPTDAADLAAHAEYLQVVEQVEYERQFKTTYLEMFRNPAWRKRSLLVMFLLFAGQSTGVLGIGNYIVIVYQNLGLTGSMPLLLNAVYTCTGTSVTVLSSFIMDKVGRRRLFLIGFPLTGLALLAEALLTRQYAKSDNKTGNAAAVFFLFFYIVVYDIFIDPPSFVYAAEIWPTAIRPKGIALAFAAYFVGAITYTTPAAVAFKNIGWKFYLVWIGCNVVSTIVIYFYLPESKGRSMEEMGDLFGDVVVVHLAQDGKGLVKGDVELPVPVSEKEAVIMVENQAADV
ncbi:general substrate transporter [Lophium mytilinum]|uniref:General substrate transporter n=1 Tax=Lophium mytilinum TaxID=390894 RepID=A0A6A6RDX7_9PEZI|nr:general substrate transporter [Lophium mytilinum]